jgi:hypothetical protein
MKVIDLIDDIRNNKPLPKKIKINNYIFELDEYLYNNNNSFECVYTDGSNYWLRNFNKYDFWLSSDLEIIEEDKEIEEIPFNNGMKEFIDVYHELEHYNYKINELIKAVNELKKGK